MRIQAIVTNAMTIVRHTNQDRFGVVANRNDLETGEVPPKQAFPNECVDDTDQQCPSHKETHEQEDR